jgi:hypothetical protein
LLLHGYLVFVCAFPKYRQMRPPGPSLDNVKCLTQAPSVRSDTQCSNNNLHLGHQIDNAISQNADTVVSALTDSNMQALFPDRLDVTENGICQPRPRVQQEIELTRHGPHSKLSCHRKEISHELVPRVGQVDITKNIVRKPHDGIFDLIQLAAPVTLLPGMYIVNGSLHTWARWARIETTMCASGLIKKAADTIDEVSPRLIPKFQHLVKATVTAMVIGLPGGVAADTSTVSYGTTLSGGIQDVSAIAGLLGTEACAQHALNCFTGGYLYVASQPWSMLGSLGAVKAALYVVCPQKWLRKAGFTECGKLLHIMVDDDDKKKDVKLDLSECMIDEGRMPSKAELVIDKELKKWLLSSTVMSMAGMIGILPFLWPLVNQWMSGYSAFPILRVLSSCVISALIPLRLLGRLVSSKVDAGTIVLNGFLVLASIGVVIGYLGSFTYIQQFADQRMSYVWVATELVLAAARVLIWGCDPKWDNLNQITIKFSPDRQRCGVFRLPEVEMSGIGCPVIIVTISGRQVQRMAIHAGLRCKHTPPGDVFYTSDESKGRRVNIVCQKTFKAPGITGLRLLRPVLQLQGQELVLLGWAIGYRGGPTAVKVLSDFPGGDTLVAEYLATVPWLKGIMIVLERAQGVMHGPSYSAWVWSGEEYQVEDPEETPLHVENGSMYFDRCTCIGCKNIHFVHDHVNSGKAYLRQGELNLELIEDDFDEDEYLVFRGVRLLTALGASDMAILRYFIFRSLSPKLGSNFMLVLRITLAFFVMDRVTKTTTDLLNAFLPNSLLYSWDDIRIAATRCESVTFNGRAERQRLGADELLTKVNTQIKKIRADKSTLEQVVNKVSKGDYDNDLLLLCQRGIFTNGNNEKKVPQ